MASLVYRLGKSDGQKKSKPTDLGYYATGDRNGGNVSQAMPMPYSRRLKAIHTVRVEKDGKKVPRKVAYSPNEESIFMDEWIDPNSPIEKLKFKKGILIIDGDRQPQKAELADILDSNENNPNRDTKTAVVFHQVNKSKEAARILVKEERVAKELAHFWDIPFTRKQALANWMGINTYGDENLWVHRLYMLAKSDVKKFKEVFNNPDLEYMDFISRAENIGLIRFNTNSWKYGDVKLLIVPRHDMRYQKLIEYLINEPLTYKAIHDEVLKAEGKSSLIVTEEAKYNFEAMTAADLLEAAKENKLVKYKGATGFYVVDSGKTIGTKTKESAIAAIESEPLLRQMIEEEFKKLI